MSQVAAGIFYCSVVVALLFAFATDAKDVANRQEGFTCAVGRLQTGEADFSA